jgi:FkbM family methyltransferase
MQDRIIPSLLRAVVVASKFFSGGRGVGFACTVAANLIGTGGRVSFRLASGGSFTVETGDRYWLNYLLLAQSYEADLDHFLTRALTSRDSFLDCGANVGLWSIAVTSVIGDTTRVVAVEAGSRTFAQLEQNWIANDRSFTILHKAVGTVSGEQVSFFTSVSDHASATLDERLSPDDAQVEFVTTVSLPDLVAEQVSRQSAGDALTFVKLDIEGMERQVFSTIQPQDYGSTIILYEDHGSEINHVTAFVLERGFQVAFLADDGTLEPIGGETLWRLDGLKKDPTRGYNLLAFAPTGAAASRMVALFGLHVD